MKITKVALIPMVAACLFTAARASSIQSTSDEINIYEQSNLWPQRAAIKEPIQIPGDDMIVPAARQGVLIRLEKGENEVGLVAVIDFGRLGIAEVPVSNTDILQRASDLSSGAAVKDYPNWTMMLGRGFADAEKGGSRVPLRDLAKYNYFLIIYAADLESIRKPLAQFMQANKEPLNRTGTLPVLFPQGDSLTADRLLKELKKWEPSLYYMLPYLSEPYAISMHHNVNQRLPAAVLTDVNGKTITFPEKADNFSEELKAIHQTLVELSE